MEGASPLASETRFSWRITATWWYTAVGVLLMEAMLGLVWLLVLVVSGLGSGLVATVVVAYLVWLGSTVPLLLRYRRDGASSQLLDRQILVPLLVAAGCGGVAGVASGLWAVGVAPLAQSLMLLHWPRGLRVRVAIAATLLLFALWFVDSEAQFAEQFDGRGGSFLGLYSLLFVPAATVVSLWWWDVLVVLDRARASEARLGATQERLRVATDVHDLQGHHLQVIALQLELAERLMAKDPDAALEQLRAARASVDEARQGTRDLATRFRSVPLRDELANAVDLLRAAGAEAEAVVDAAADGAPADVLGPVIRETTTNVLRHGGGEWARLRLARSGALWRYEISNDAAAGAEADGRGSGLDGVARRIAEVGGALDVRRGRHEFAVIVTVPAVPVAAGTIEGAATTGTTNGEAS